MEISHVIYINDLASVSGLCYVCLTESKKMLLLRSKIEPICQGGTTTIWELLKKVVRRNIKYDKRHPAYLCPMCFSLLKISFKLQYQFEQSQNLLTEYFGESQSDLVNEVEECELKEFAYDKAPVELISKHGKFNLNDIIVIDAVNDERPDFSGFLKNLGQEVSATFVNEPKSPSGNFNQSVSLIKIPSNNGEDNVEPYTEVTLGKSILEDDMDETDRKINRRISRCVYCKKIFANNQYMKKHIARMHSHCKKQSFVCEICGTYLQSRSALYRHTRKHMGKKHMCNHCQKMYYDVVNLEQHIMSKHTNIRPHLCNICGKTFTYANALAYHMRIHTGERKYSCSYCTRTFTMRCGLNRHLRVHTGIRPYQCKYCDKAFRSKGEVNCHEMIHTGYRPFSCAYCGKGFTKGFNLKMHLLAHPGSHACDICKKTFIEVKYLRMHMKSSHGYIEATGEDIRSKDTERLSC